MSHTSQYLGETVRIAELLDQSVIEALVESLANLRDRGGRLFFLGLGGSAANCSHAVNDFRKILGIQAFCATDNAAEFTARVNDDGWFNVFTDWLRCSKLNDKDALFILSVGGGLLGERHRTVSPNLVSAINYAETVGAGIFGIVGRNGGYTATKAGICVIVPTVNADHITPHSESFQSVILHLIVSHPRLSSSYSTKNTMAGLAYEP